MKKPVSYYKIAATFFGVTLLLTFLQLHLVLIPIYELVGKNTPDVIDQFNNLRQKGKVFGGLIYLCLVMSGLSLIIGVARTSRRKYGRKL
jgi:hypothetical protein